MEHTIQGINTVAVTQAIQIMERVIDRGSEVIMANWQTPFLEDGTQGVAQEDLLCTDEMEMHNCGTAACFAGWVAVSPEWKRIGGSIDPSGGPLLRHKGQELFGSEAIAAWLNIPQHQAELLTCISAECTGRTAYYGKPLYFISASDVIGKLKEMLH